MSAKDFLAGDYLSRADLVLVRGSSLFSRAIRFATRSPFSHTALVFVIPNRDLGFHRSFLIEAVPKGVRLSGLAELTKADAKGLFKADAVILRLEQPWFTRDVQALVRGRMLDFIRSGYDWRTVLGIAMSVAKGAFGGRDTFARALTTSLRNAYHRRGLAPANFICSGLVQYGFLRAIHDHATEPSSPVPPGAGALAVFNERLAKLDPAALLGGSPEARAALLATTPEEISRAPQLTWKYLMTKGRVHAVSSRDEAVALLGGSRG